MNNKLLLLALAVVSFTSCSTIYKSGQTPDDVYYSPVRLAGETSRSETQNEERNYSRERNYLEDRQIRFGIYDPRWRNFDNDISYNPYRYGFNSGYYYNPYYYPFPVYNNIIVVAAPNPKNSTPRMTNLGAYNSNYSNYNTNSNTKTGSPYRAPVRSYNNNNGSKLGNALRNVFSSDTPSGYNSNNSGNSSQSNRSYTPSSSGTRSSGSSGSSSGGATSRPTRNGKG